MSCNIILPLICLQSFKNEKKKKKNILSLQICPLAVVYQTLFWN